LNEGRINAGPTCDFHSAEIDQFGSDAGIDLFGGSESGLDRRSRGFAFARAARDSDDLDAARLGGFCGAGGERGGGSGGERL